MNQVLVAALYKFAVFPDFEDWREPLLGVCNANDVKGSLLIASEGINGTIAGFPDGIRAVLDLLRQDHRFVDLECKLSTASASPFDRMKVLLKQEIVTMGIPAIDPNRIVGTYVDPEDWNDLLEDPAVVVIDTRNDYEVAIGTFKGAVDPKLKSFKEFPGWLRKRFSPGDKPKVAMFCTGGIRCEKSTAFLKQAGIEEVFHLRGGILEYLDTIPEEDSLWEGQCFVFDQRVSLGHGLRAGNYAMCRACGAPVSESDRQDPEYIEGVQCPGCVNHTTALQKEKFAARVGQEQRSKARRKGAPWNSK